MDLSISNRSSNSLRLLKILIVDCLSNKIQVQASPTFVIWKALPLRPQLANRHPSGHILNTVSNPGKLAVLLEKDRFTKMCVDSLIIRVACKAAGSENGFICVLVFSSIWEVSQYVIDTSPGSMVYCVCTCTSKLQIGKSTSMRLCFPQSQERWVSGLWPWNRILLSCVPLKRWCRFGN